MSETARLTFQEVLDVAGLPERTVRFYISQGLVPPASGRGRSAYYTPLHVQRLARITAWRAERRSLSEIRELLLAEQVVAPDDALTERWLRIWLHDDLELHVRVGAPTQIQALAEQLREVANQWFYGATDE